MYERAVAEKIHVPCNKNQLDALFILSLFRQSTSTCFGHICRPSSGGILYMYNKWYVLCWKEGCLIGTRCMCIYIYIYIHSIPTDDGLQICPKHVEVEWRNKLRINSASSWFSLHRCIAMQGQQNIKKRNTCYLLNFYSCVKTNKHFLRTEILFCYSQIYGFRLFQQAVIKLHKLVTYS